MDPLGAPRLSAKARLREDGKTGETFLLYPERGLKLNPRAAEIVRLCDGGHDRAEIIRILAQRAGAEDQDAKAEVAADVGRFLEALSDKGLLEWTHP